MRKTQKRILIAAAAAAMALSIPLIAFMDDGPGLNKEELAVKDALTGAVETQIQLGQYPASEDSDGTDSALSDKEINQLISDYNARVDRYYTKDFGGYDYYKFLENYYLTDVSRKEVQYLVDADVPDCSIQSVRFSDNGNAADVEAYIMTSSQWVDYDKEERAYKVLDSISVEHGNYRLVKDSGQWKVKKVTDLNEASDGITPETAAKSLSRGADIKASDIRKAVAHKDQVASASYPDFGSALKAVKTVDNKLITDNINPVKLAKLSTEADQG